ncbi:unnamed protein product [Aphanomyces euteiches]|uniref:Uncharacterized protein n=1 Tax=Aphanomyces euteiches TaxID=100861 RepID=A0A6G0WDP4_9STRA|nr:hypothetical protein Ae201684_015944 [Aphanomyces euteiches]KAH9088400.1 hypothetical protein Ae201684P_003093 [Aphanomyces euteiches]
MKQRRKRCLTLEIAQDNDENCLGTKTQDDNAWWKSEYTLPPSGHLGAHNTIQPKNKHDDRLPLFPDTKIQIDPEIEIQVTTATSTTPQSSANKRRRMSKDRDLAIVLRRLDHAN